MLNQYVARFATINGATTGVTTSKPQTRDYTFWASGTWDGSRANIQASWNVNPVAGEWFETGQSFIADGWLNLSIAARSFRANVVGANATTNVSVIVTYAD